MKKTNFIFITFLLLILHLRCNNDDENLVVEIQTLEITSKTHNSAKCIGKIDNQELNITSIGVCWDCNPNPTLENNYSEDSLILNTFESYLTKLLPKTTYYVRPYFLINRNIYYGNEISFTTKLEGLPTIETIHPKSINKNSFLSGGIIVDNGNLSIKEVGLCWSLRDNPTINDSLIKTVANNNNFSILLESLKSNTKYYIRSYAINEVGIGYGNEVCFTTSYGSIFDYDGNSYQTIKIGDQIIMRENLKTTHYADGRIINDGTGVGYDDDIFNRYWFQVNGNISNKESFGLLYNWAGIMDNNNSSKLNPSGVQGICPDGWHVPSDKEWKELELFLKIPNEEIDEYGYRGTTQGTELKIGGYTGFDALMSGIRAGAGYYSKHGSCGFFMSSTEENNDAVLLRKITSGTSYIERMYYSKKGGISVRCFKD